MGCLCSRGVSANIPNKSLFVTTTITTTGTDDDDTSTNNGNDGKDDDLIIKSHYDRKRSNDHNHSHDLHFAQNFDNIQSIAKMIKVDYIPNVPMPNPGNRTKYDNSSPFSESQALSYSQDMENVARFPLCNSEHTTWNKLFKQAQLADDISIMIFFQLYKGQILTLVIPKSLLWINMYALDLCDMPEHRETYSCRIGLIKDSNTVPNLQIIYMYGSPEYNKMGRVLLKFLNEGINRAKSQKQRNIIHMKPILASSSSNVICSATASLSKSFNLYPLSACEKIFGPFSKIKLITTKGADFSSNGSDLTKEKLQLPSTRKTVNGTYNKKRISVRFEDKPLFEREIILLYLYINWEDLQQDSALIESLKETKFVMGADGDLHKPKDLFDPGDALLTSVFSDEVHKFPGEKFVSDGWLNILRKTGLQSTSDADIVLECARRVEFLGVESLKHMRLVDNNRPEFSETMIEVSAEIWSLAETLIKAVFERFLLLYSHNFCSIFGKIRCIPAEFGFPFENGKKVLCSYSEAILLKDWPLAWTTSPILTMVPPEYSWGALQLSSPPPFTKVLNHLKSEGWRINSSILSIEDASIGILKYLDTIWGELSSSDIFELQQLAIVAADNGTHFVTCDSLFLELTINLSPLASKLPSRYLPFLKILKELGVKDMLSISCVLIILSSFQKSCAYYRLNPNELHAVIELLNFLCNETIKQQISKRSKRKMKLVVPDTDCRLARPHSCVYIDQYASRYVNYIDSSKLRIVHHDISERFCLVFGIQKLSDVVMEELYRPEHYQTLDGIGSISLAAIRKKLLSRSFQVAVSSVFNNVLKNTSRSTKTPDFQMLQRSFESVAQSLKFVKCIYTRFWLLPKSLDITLGSKEPTTQEWRSGPSHQALYYVDRSKTCMLISEPPSYVSVIDLVALVVSHVLGSPVQLQIGSLFLCPPDSETALLDILKLSCIERATDGVGYGTGFLGTYILPGDAKKRKSDPLRSHYQGEIVAWQRQSGEKLKYGRIYEDVRPSAGQAFYSVNIETFPGKTETVFSTNVYSFRNFRHDSKSPTYVSRGYSMHVERSDESHRGAFRNQKQAIKDTEHGLVPPKKFVQVVKEMLSSAQINMNLEKQCLLQTTLSLQEQLNETQAALLLKQEKSELAAKEADFAKAALLCQICFTNEIGITIDPCGHLLCHQCSSAVFCCPICRGQLSTTIRIYRS